MRLLVVHQNFPGQFGHMVQAWAQRPGWDVRALGRDTAPGLPGFNGLQRYRLAPGAMQQQHHFEAATRGCRGELWARLKNVNHRREHMLGVVPPDGIRTHACQMRRCASTSTQGSWVSELQCV